MTRCGECGQVECDKETCPGWSVDQSELQEALVGGPLMNVLPSVNRPFFNETTQTPEPSFLGVPIITKKLPNGVAAVFVNNGEIVGTIMERDLDAQR